MAIMCEAIIITGMPGIGKTTLISNVIEIVKDRGYIVGGMITQEIRDKQKRYWIFILARKGFLRTLV